MEITNIRSRWPEKAGFKLWREHGAGESILLYFYTPALITFGGRETPIEKGAFIVFRAGTPHGFFSPGPLMHDWMHLTGDVEARMNNFSLEPDALYYPSNTAYISETVSRLETEFFAMREYRREMLDLLMDELFLSVSRALKPVKSGVDEALAQRLREARNLMLGAPENKWSCAALSRMIGVSESRLFSAYRHEFGITPNRDLMLMRLEKAKRLLDSGKTVAETAELAGYGGVYQFIRQFKKLEGATPKKYALRG